MKPKLRLRSPQPSESQKGRSPFSLEKRAEGTYAEYRRQKESESGGRGFRLPLCWRQRHPQKSHAKKMTPEAFDLRLAETPEVIQNRIVPGIVRSFPPLVADTFQMAKANDEFHSSEVPSTDPRNVDPWPLSLVRVPYKIRYRTYTAVVLRLGNEFWEVCLDSCDLVYGRLLGLYMFTMSRTPT
jgi:hypothetical protein